MKKKNNKHMKVESSRHAKTTAKRKLDPKKIIRFILIVLIIILAIYFIINKISNNDAKEANLSTEQSSDIIKQISTHQKIKDLEHVEVTGINISKKNSSTNIEIKLKNNSENIQPAFTAHLSLLDTNGYILFGLRCSIPEISSNSEISYNIITNDDLNNANSYDLVIKN